MEENMKKCKSCQKDIDIKATKCPYCQTDQRGWFKKHPILTGIMGFIILLIILGAIGGNSSKSNSTITTSPPNNDTTPVTSIPNSISSPTQSAQAKDATFKVGETAKLGAREFVVNSVRRSQGFNYSTPKKGKEYVIVNVTIRNLGTDEVSYNPFDFKIQDANGAQESETFASLDDSLSSGTLASNGKVTGSMPFEVPIGDAAKLIFQPSFWRSERVVIDLGNK